MRSLITDFRKCGLVGVADSEVLSNVNRSFNNIDHYRGPDYPWTCYEEMVLLFSNSTSSLALSNSAHNHHVLSVHYRALTHTHKQKDKHSFSSLMPHTQTHADIHTNTRCVLQLVQQILLKKHLTFLSHRTPSHTFCHSQMRSSVTLFATRLHSLCRRESVTRASVPQGEVVPCAAHWTGNGRAHRSWCWRLRASAPSSCGEWCPVSLCTRMGTAAPPVPLHHGRSYTWVSPLEHWREKETRML